MPRPNVREKLIEAGLNTLMQKGFNGCGVQEITDAAGVPKGSFYNHFASKEALGAEIVERVSQNNPRRAILADTSLPPLERLRRHLAALIERAVENDFERGCLLGNFSAEMSSQSPLIRERLHMLSTSWTEEIAAVVREAQADGSIRSNTPAEDLAAFLLDAYEGTLLRVRIEKNGAAFDRLMKLVFTQILV
jgi:TetR/AcrR family transcriptional repressor of nem operon